jgi:hypothetical protein
MITTLLILWVVISIWWTISFAPKNGSNRWWHWIIGALVIMIAASCGAIINLLRRPRAPVVVSGLSIQNDPPKKYCTQVRIFGEKGKYYHVDIFSDTEPTYKIYSEE